MSRTRIQVNVDIEILSPLHIGTGLERTVEAVRGAPGANMAPAVASIQRDHQGVPYLPGSTVKGLLRRLAVESGVIDYEHLLGSVKRRGGLIVSGVSLHQPGCADHFPYADRPDNRSLGAGVFVAAGTRIDRRDGAAAANSLHHAEAVAPGGLFRL